MKRHALVLALSLALAAPAAFAEDAKEPAGKPDVVVLKDGSRLEGVIVAENDQYVSLRVGGVTRAYPKSRITSVEKGTRSAELPPAESRGDRRDGKDKAARKKAGKTAAKGKAAPLGPAAIAWIDKLAERAADDDPAVRRSVMAALRALGPAAAAPIDEAAKRTDGPASEFLRRAAKDIRQSASRKAAKGKGKGKAGKDRRGMDRAQRGARGRQMIDKIAVELDLGDEQRPQFSRILKEMQQSQMKLGRQARQDGMAPEQVKEQLATLKTDTLAALKGVLSEPQHEVLSEMLTRYFANHGKRGKGKKGKGDGFKRKKKNKNKKKDGETDT